MKALEFLLASVLIVSGVFLFSSQTLWASLLVVVGLIYVGLLGRTTGSVMLAHLSFRRGDVKKTLAWFSRGWKSRSMDLTSSITYAYLLLKENELEGASSVIGELLSNGLRGKPLSEQDRCLVTTYQSLVSWKSGNLDQAIELLETLLSSGYRTAVLYGSLGYFLLEKGNLEEALRVNKEAAEYAPDDKVILDNLGSTWIRLSQWDKAGEIYAKLLLLDPTFPEAWYNAGAVELELGNHSKAHECWTKALDLPFNALSTIEKQTVRHALDGLVRNSHHRDLSYGVESGNAPK